MRGNFRKLWVGDRLDELRRRWLDNQSQTQIANAMSTTRSAVGGVVHRLRARGEKLDHSTPIPVPFRDKIKKQAATATEKPATIDPQPTRKPMMEIIAQTAATEPPPTRQCRLLDLTSTTCRWPLGDPSHADFYFCGELPENGYPYCSFHCCKAYIPNRRYG